MNRESAAQTSLTVQSQSGKSVRLARVLQLSRPGAGRSTERTQEETLTGLSPYTATLHAGTAEAALP